MDSLELRCEKVSESARKEFVSQLCKPKWLNPTNRAHWESIGYLKGDISQMLDDRLSVCLQSEPVNSVTGLLYNAFPKAILKRPQYGMVDTPLPPDLLRNLTVYEAVYMFTGIWQRKAAADFRHETAFSPENAQNNSVYNLVLMNAKNGIRFLRRKKRDFELAGMYKDKNIDLPEAKELESLPYQVIEARPRDRKNRPLLFTVDKKYAVDGRVVTVKNSKKSPTAVETPVPVKAQQKKLFDNRPLYFQVDM